MKHYVYYRILSIIIYAGAVGLSASSASVKVIPQPAHYELTESEFIIDNNDDFSGIPDSLCVPTLNFIDGVASRTGITLGLNGYQKGNIRFVQEPTLGPESYGLKVSPDSITITASDKNGYIYALQTLRQLITRNDDEQWVIPCVSIEDSPRFGYRGMLMDVSRYFLPKNELLRLIDVMELLKLNTLHLHLTDDNGWRIEIKQYPGLTDIGAWRVDRESLPFPARRNPEPGEPTPVGGYYTQNDIREIVNYAANRGIEVIPEIDMPAHANAALAAYPQYACPVVDKFIGVLPGIGGDNADIIYCAGNDSTFVFLKNILDEVMELFPSRYIHLGGDEAWKTNWDKCPLCQSRIEKEHLDNSEELQGWFMTVMSDYVRSKGRQVIGWDELTNSKLPEEVTVMGWQGNGNAALKAAAQGHNFILTPARLMYFIRYQGPQWFEPYSYFAGGTLKDVYEYEPVKSNWKPEYENLLLGLQGSMWNEFSRSPSDVQYQLFPRLTALADAAWRPKGTASWDDYLVSLDTFLPLLDEMGVIYARSMYNIQQTVKPDNGRLIVTLECIRPDVEIRYTTDGTDPDVSSALYTGPLTIDSSVKELKAATFADGIRKGALLELPFVWNLATGREILNPKVEEYRLVNGVKGSIKQTDLEWCSWDDCSNVEFVLDLGTVQPVNEIDLGFVNNFGMAVHRPACVAVSLSSDNEIYTDVARKEYSPEEIFTEGNFTTHETFDVNGRDARYVKIRMKGPGGCPPTHTRPGKEVKFYVDEIIVK